MEAQIAKRIYTDPIFRKKLIAPAGARAISIVAPPRNNQDLMLTTSMVGLTQSGRESGLIMNSILNQHDTRPLPQKAVVFPSANSGKTISKFDQLTNVEYDEDGNLVIGIVEKNGKDKRHKHKNGNGNKSGGDPDKEQRHQENMALFRNGRLKKNGSAAGYFREGIRQKKK